MKYTRERQARLSRKLEFDIPFRSGETAYGDVQRRDRCDSNCDHSLERLNGPVKGVQTGFARQPRRPFVHNGRAFTHPRVNLIARNTLSLGAVARRNCVPFLAFSASRYR